MVKKALEGTLGLVRSKIELSGGFVVTHRDVRESTRNRFSDFLHSALAARGGSIRSVNMKEIKGNQNKSQATAQTTIDWGNIVTLRDLKGIMPDTKRVKTPTWKELRSLQPILQQPLEDGGLWVYSNGFAVYKSGRRTTVLRIACASSHTYKFSDGDKNCSLNDQPWATALVLYGEGRIEQNTREWDERRSVHYDGFDDFNENDEPEGEVVLTGSDDVEGTVVNKLDNRMELILSCLTKRQRQIFTMYYNDDMKQQEIADELGIARRVVGHTLDDAISKLQKNFKEF